MRLAVFALAAASLFGQIQDKHAADNQNRDRGQTRPADESQSWTRGRLGAQAPLPEKSGTYNGILIDATCSDRTALNLGRAPEQHETAQPDPKTEQPPDTAARMPDRSCAITGGTRGFALLTADGRLLNLDEGGNTYANQALYSSAAGRAMMNGTGGGVKPQSTIRGRVQGDRLIVEKILVR